MIPRTTIPRTFLLPILGLALVPLSTAGSAQQTAGPSGPSVGPSPHSPSGPSAGPASMGDTGEDELITRRYPLYDLLPVIDQDEYIQPLFEAPGMGNYHFEEHGYGAANLSLEIDCEPVFDLLGQAFGDELSDLGREMNYSGLDNSLSITASAELHDRAKEMLAGLRTAFGARALVTVDILTLEGQLLTFPKSATASTAQADALINAALTRGASHVRHELEIVPGSAAISDMTQPLAVMLDYDVEIAQDAFIWDPIPSTLDLGQRIVIRGVPDGDRLQISALLRTVDLVGEVNNRSFGTAGFLASEQKGPTYAAGPDVLQQAEVAMSSFAFTGDVTMGNALICASELNISGSMRSQLVVIRPLEITGRALFRQNLSSGEGRELVVVNTEAFSPSSVNAWFLGHDELDADVVGPFIYSQIEANSDGADPLMSKAFEFSANAMSGPWIMIAVDPTWDRISGDAIERIADSWSAPEDTISLTLDLLASGRGDNVPARTLLPSWRGHRAAAIVGLARNVVYDYDVEVAQGAAVADPVVLSAFQGLGAVARPGLTSVMADAALVLPSGRPTQLDLGGMTYGLLDHHEEEILRVRSRHSVGAGGVATFGAKGVKTLHQVLQLRATIK
ncbi:MAG: hypothetical protein ACI8PQ_002742 [Planctomycetota bacterium]|jgi:hypothetical protein